MTIPLLNQFNWIDVFILVLLFRGAYLGFSKGAAWGGVRTIGTLGVTLAAFSKSHLLAQWAHQTLKIDSPFLEWIFFILLGIGLAFLADFILDRAVHALGLVSQGWAGRTAGAALGLVQTGLFVSLVLAAMVLSSNGYLQASVKERSYLGTSFLKAAPAVYRGAAGWIPGGGSLSDKARRQFDGEG